MQCSDRHQEQSVKKPVFGGILKTACLASIETLDPQQLIFKTDYKAASIVYEGLTTFVGDCDEPKPCLAESWALSSDGKKLTFFLRDSVFFHNDPCFPNSRGRRLCADDVIYTFHRLADARTQCLEYSMFAGKIIGIDDYHTGKTKHISGIVKNDSLTVTFMLTRPFAAFFKYLATHICYIVPQEAVTYYGDSFSHHPVGTGAFRLSRWQQLKTLYFERHSNYWKKDNYGRHLPYLDSIHLHLISRPVMVISELYKDNLDLATLNQKQFDQLVNQDKLHEQHFMIQATPSYNIRFFAFSLNKTGKATLKPDLRQAIACGFNREEILNSLNTTPAQTFVPAKMLRTSETTWYTYDPRKAELLVKNSGYAGEQFCIASNIETEEVNQLQLDCLQLGLNAELCVQKSDYYSWVFKERPVLFRVSFQPNYPDPEAYYNLFYSKIFS
ncbi:MAG: ABC transporter substrate-binding protein [candidate division KSB1 bacterium]|nr:ABC transporter substrate-binding protein [candidate division KSB1 bacterium]